MDVDLSSNNTIELRKQFKVNKNELWEHLTELHLMRLWFADEVDKTPIGFVLSIKLPLHTIELNARIIEKQPPNKYVFTWDSEYIMDTSLITIRLIETNSGVELYIVEKGPFDESRWQNPREIHVDIWKEALQRLENILD